MKNLPSVMLSFPEWTSYRTALAAKVCRNVRKHLLPPGILRRKDILRATAVSFALVVIGLGAMPAASQSGTYTGTQTTLASGLGSPAGIAVDSTNTVYIADTNNARILVETPGASGYTQTVITNSAILAPVAIAVDTAGNLYVINRGSTTNLIKLTSGTYASRVISSSIGTPTSVAVTPDGTALYVVDSSAGSVYQYAYASGSYIQQTTATGFTQPLGVATDATGAWYVLANGSVLKHSAGFVNGSTVYATLVSGLSPTANALDLDAAGNIFVADTGNNRIVEALYSSGSGYTLRTLTSSNAPQGVGVDSNGVVSFANTGGNTAVAQNLAATNFGTVNVGTTSATQTLVFAFSATTTLNASAPYQALLGGAGNQDYTVVAGSGTTCTASATFASGATCTVQVTFTPAYPGPRNGALLLNDSNGAQTGLAYLAGVASGPQVAFAPTQSPIGSGLNAPYGVAVDGAGNVYIADNYNNRVVKEVYSNGTYTQSSTTIGSGLSYPGGVAVDGAGNVYIADVNNNRVVKEVYSNGTYTQSSTTIGSGLYSPGGVAVDGAGNVYIADAGHNRVVKEVYSNGTYTQSSTTIGSGLSYPYGVAVDGAGNVYIANANNNRVVKEVYSNGTYTQSSTTIGSGLYSPGGVAVDGAGNVYIADAGNRRVVKEVYSNGTYTQSSTTIGSGLSAPEDVAVDGAGNVYIADSGNNRVLLENVQKGPTLSFASTAVGTTSADSPQQVVVSNTGDQPLTISSVRLSPSTNFTADPSACLATPIIAGGSCALNLSYTPQQAGSHSTMAEIFDNNLLVAVSKQTAQLNGGAATKGDQTITFTQPANGGTYTAGAVIPFSATSTSGLTVAYRVTKTGTVTLSSTIGSNGNSVTVTGGSGTVIITASQAGGADYNAAPDATLTLNVVATPASGSSLTDTAVGSSSTATITAPVTTAGTLGSVQGLLQGASGLDYSAALGSDCAAGQAMTVGQVCSLQVTFSPTKTGPRYGAVELLDVSGNILGTTYLQANGLGPQIAFAPSQVAIGSGLKFPSGIAVDGAGNVYIADNTSNSRVVKEIYSNGSYTQSSTTIGNGLSYPNAVAVDGAGNVYIADTDNSRVVKEVYSNGTYSQSSTAIGSGLTAPEGVAVDGAGNVYIADTGNDRVVKEVYSSGTYTQSSTSIGSGLNYPTAVAVEGAGNVYIADQFNNRVLKEVYSNGAYTQSSIGSGIGQPYAVAVDGAGNVYIADGNNNRVLKEVYSNGIYTQSTTTIGNGLGSPYGLAVDGAGNVYIADPYNNRGLVERVDGVGTPPAVDFTKGGTATTATGATSAPLATTITNLGNQPLIFPVPPNGLNPQTAANFALETNSHTSCPTVNAGGTAGQVAANTTCTLSYVFAPTQLGALTSTSVLTNNNLNVTGAAQSITLKGQATQGTQTAQTITFPQPASVYPGSAALAASASSGLLVTYTLVSGPATLSGSTLTYTGPGAVVVTANQAGNVQYSAAPPVSITINVTQAVAQISWSPAKLSAYTGFILDATILDATDSIPATITYTAVPPSGTSIPVDSTGYTTALTRQGTYQLTAQFVPGDSVRYATTSLTFPLTVQNMNVFVANAAGTVTSLYNNGTVQTSAISGGGLGAAVDSSGFVWSINADRNGVSKFTNVGALAARYNGTGGVNAATALTVDGNGTVWVTNGGGTVSALTSSGTAAQNAVGSAANLSSPTSISVDPSGSLWIANAGNNTVTEIIGAAAPVTTPLARSVVNNTVAARP